MVLVSAEPRSLTLIVWSSHEHVVGLTELGKATKQLTPLDTAGFWMTVRMAVSG